MVDKNSQFPKPESILLLSLNTVIVESTQPVNVPFTPKMVTPFLMLDAIRLEDPTITITLDK